MHGGFTGRGLGVDSLLLHISGAGTLLGWPPTPPHPTPITQETEKCSLAVRQQRRRDPLGRFQPQNGSWAPAVKIGSRAKNVQQTGPICFISLLFVLGVGKPRKERGGQGWRVSWEVSGSSGSSSPVPGHLRCSHLRGSCAWNPGVQVSRGTGGQRLLRP